MGHVRTEVCSTHVRRNSSAEEVPSTSSTDRLSGQALSSSGQHCIRVHETTLLSMCSSETARLSTIPDVKRTAAKYAKNDSIDTRSVERDIKYQLLERKPATKFNKHQYNMCDTLGHIVQHDRGPGKDSRHIQNHISAPMPPFAPKWSLLLRCVSLFCEANLGQSPIR